MRVAVTKGKVIARWSEQAGSALQTQRRVLEGHPVLVVDHGVAETKVLRNLGYDVPAPILSQYEWPGEKPPFDSQKVTAALLSMEPRAYCLSSMGVGKTRAVLYAFDYLRQGAHPIGPMLVVAPLSTLVDVWEREVFESFYHLKTVVLYGSRKKRIEQLKEDADIYIINHDGVEVILPQLIAKKFGLVVPDEIGAYRNPGTDRWKVLNKLINGPQQLPTWGLTGSPTPNAPTDVFGISKLLTPWRVPRSFNRFRQDTMLQITPFKWIPRASSYEKAADALKPSVRFTLDECHDIPPTTYSWRHVDMGRKQEALYKLVAEKFRAEFKNTTITAVNEAGKLQKLLQISAGFVYSKEKGLYIDAKDRMRLVLDLIEEAEKKVLVFANFTWLVHSLRDVIGTRYSSEMITGAVPKKKRDAIFSGFRNDPDPHVIVADAGTMAHGLSLVSADTIIWYGPPLSSDTYEQANARVRRPGQDSKTHVVHIESTPVERHAFRRLQTRQKMQGMLLEILEGAHHE